MINLSNSRRGPGLRLGLMRTLTVLLLLALLLSGCSGGDPADTTGAPADTSCVTTEPQEPGSSAEDTTIAVPDTTEPQESTGAETTVPVPTTASVPVTPSSTVKVLRSLYARDSLAGKETDGELLRNSFLATEYGIAISETLTMSFTTDVKNLALAGEHAYDLLLPSLDGEAMSLITDGLLADLSLRSFGLTVDEDSLSSALSINGKFYLLFSDAVTSDLLAATALDITSAGAAAETISALSAAGNLTPETLLLVIKDSKPGVSFDEDGALALFGAAGGSIFIKDENGIPSVNVRTESFDKAYTSVLPLTSMTAAADGIKVTLLSAADAGSILVPLPKASSDAKELSPVLVKYCSAIAVPITAYTEGGIAVALEAIDLASSPVRKESIEALKQGPEGRANTVERIIASETIETAAFFGWGSFDGMVTSALIKGNTVSDILSDRLYSIKEKTAANAAVIISGRLG